MDRIIYLKKKNGEVVKGTFKKLDSTYIDKIMEFQEEILEGLEDKQLYAPTDREDFYKYYKRISSIIGCFTEKEEFIAMAVYIKNDYDEENYGYDIGLKGEELLKVGQIESTLVREEYRGNGLQRIMCEILEKEGSKTGATIMMATASPDNLYSLNTFKALGYEVVKEKIKYGGYKRFILKKYVV